MNGAGAVISYSGETLVASGADIVEAASGLLDRTSRSDRGDRWLTDVVPVLARGSAWIVPLFSAPSSGDVDEEGRRTLDDRASELGQSITSACWYNYGEPLGVALVGRAEGGRIFASELVRTGAKDASWWAVGDSALVLVYYGEPSPAPKSRMALHVVPVGWVSDRRPTPPKKMPPLDLAWSWADVVALHRAPVVG
ncbi:hypothetical protein AB3M89_09885 [Microbacterium sp. 179-I 3D2 NHS]|uniref:hypothetical protein n=1 Tax=Microbacterium sp. 179-I 3D2 NHS TaxID=3235178 RepID=UPI0039A24CF4